MSAKTLPRTLTNLHLGQRLIYVDGRRLREAILEEVSPSGRHVRLGKEWIENASGIVVEMLPDAVPAKTENKKKRYLPK